MPSSPASRRALLRELERIELLFPGKHDGGFSARAIATGLVLHRYIANNPGEGRTMSEKLLTELRRFSEQFPARHFRVSVFAWGRTIEGILITPTEYCEIVRKLLDGATASTPNMHVGAVQLVNEAREKVFDALRSDVESSLSDVFLRDVVIDGKKLVEPLRVSAGDAQGYVIHGMA
jgi:hypothetical protein